MCSRWLECRQETARKGIKFLGQWHCVDKMTKRELWEEVVEAKATDPKERIVES